jgi:hypothetical protein
MTARSRKSGPPKKRNPIRRRRPSAPSRTTKLAGLPAGGIPLGEKLGLLPLGQRRALARELLQGQGNLARERLAASHSLVQLAPLDGLNAASDDFWDLLETRVAAELSSWLSHRVGGAIEQFDTDLHARQEEGVGAFTLRTTLTLVGLIPTVGSYATTVASIAQDVYKQLPTESPVSLEDFLFNARRNIEEASLRIANRSAGIFTQINSARAAETPENRAETRRAAIGELKVALEALPSLTTILQALVTDWINSAQDSWDLGDWGGMEAGNIYVSYRYWPHIGEGLWGLAGRPFIDDVSRPEGTKQALRHAFGEDTFLHTLPFQMNVSIEAVMQGERRTHALSTVRIIKPARSDMRPDPAEPEWQLQAGPQNLLAAWQAYKHKPKIRDLVAD